MTRRRPTYQTHSISRLPASTSSEARAALLADLEQLDCRTIDSQIRKSVGLHLLGYSSDEIDKMIVPKPIDPTPHLKAVAKMQQQQLRRLAKHKYCD